MTLGSKIRIERTKLKYSQAMLGKILNVSQQAIAKWEKDIAEPDSKSLIELSKLFHVTVDYLVNEESSENLATNIYNEDILNYSIIAEIKAGFGGIAVESYTGETQEVPASIIKGHKKDDFMVLQVCGNSMYPQLFDGDRVLVRKCDSVDSGTIAIVLYNGDEATVKQVVYKQGEDWLDLIPRNPEYPPMRISGEELNHCKILGQVVYLFRKI